MPANFNLIRVLYLLPLWVVLSLGVSAQEEHYKQSRVEDSKRNSETLSSATRLQRLGNIFAQRGNFALAEQYYVRALTIREKLAPESLPMASSLSDIGVLFYKRGDLVQAEEYGRRALAIREKWVPESLDVADSFNNLGLTFDARDDLAKAQEYYTHALAIREKLAPGSLEVAFSLTNLGLTVFQRGYLLNGEAYLARALAIEEKLVPGSMYVVDCLENLGLNALQRGDLPKAEEYHHRALTTLKERGPGSLHVAYSLGRVSDAVSRRGDPGKAEKYYRQVLASIEKATPGSVGVTVGFDYFGDLFRDRGDLVKATRYYHQALAIREKLLPESLDVAKSLSSLAGVYLIGGNLLKAERYYTHALTIIEKLPPGITSDAEVLVALANINRQRHRLNTAAELFARAVSAIERQISLSGGTQNERARFRSEHVGYYKDYVDVLLAQRRPELAFQVLERSRARSFLEILADRDLVFRADLPVEIQQARRENAAAYERAQAQIARLSLERDGARIEQLQQRLRDLEAERERIAEGARKSSPRFAALQYPQPLDLAAARAALDPGTVLLSYSVSENHTVLFVVRPAGVEPGLSVFDLRITERMLRNRVAELRKLVQREGGPEAHDTRLTADERELYDLLLKPAESIIGSSERLLLIPDGPLQVLPFSALKLESGRYLVEWKPVHTAVSATVYAELRRAHPEKSDKRVELAAFGDPLYPPSAQAAATDNRNRTVDGELRSIVERGFILSRLPFSRAEVQSIAGLFTGHELRYLGEQATEEHAKSLGKGVRYIHFATHGLLDERFPLNSSLVLTIPSKPSEGQENGILQAWEIFEQVRLDADLVTLSACSTGLGQELNGEGLIGLTRAFQYAGARSVLASLWSVDDYRTMQLMERFYAELHAGASKDVALRTAQLQLLHSGAKDPYYWAAFSLVGDWR
jgi:CHAT domain-containing protein/Tfp pilus assembly protein PilF